MSDLLFAGATEELQPLGQQLERAGFRVDGCRLEETSDRLRAAPANVLLINLMDAGDGEIHHLLGAHSIPSHIATVAILRPHQLDHVNSELPHDDFVVYPAPHEEVIARLERAVRLRSEPEDAHLIRCGELTIDQASYKVFLSSRPVDLTYKEYELLRFLALNQDKVCTRETLLSRVWGYDFYGGARTVDVHIRRLRSKIEDRGVSPIETVRNVGYRLRSAP